MKGQVWINDFVIGLLIFVFLLFLSFSLIKTMNKDSTFDDIKVEVVSISSLLLSSGVPDNWSSANIVNVGITSNFRINETKLNRFDELDYKKSKAVMGVVGDYTFYFENASGIMNVSNKCYRGFDYDLCDDILLSIDYDNLAIVERVIILNSEIVKMVVLSWI